MYTYIRLMKFFMLYVYMLYVYKELIYVYIVIGIYYIVLPMFI